MKVFSGKSCVAERAIHLSLKRECIQPHLHVISLKPNNVLPEEQLWSPSCQRMNGIWCLNNSLAIEKGSDIIKSRWEEYHICEVLEELKNQFLPQQVATQLFLEHPYKMWIIPYYGEYVMDLSTLRNPRKPHTRAKKKKKKPRYVDQNEVTAMMCQILCLRACDEFKHNAGHGETKKKNQRHA